MNINIQSHDLEITEAIENYASLKLSAVEKYISKSSNANLDVEIGKTSKHHKKGDNYEVKSHLRYDSRNTYVDVIDSDVYAAIDQAKDKLLEDVAENKDKHTNVLRKVARKIKGVFKLGK